MYFTWILASRGARAEALKLDYAVYQNYWPTLEFCEQGWPTKVKRWTKKSKLTSGEIEFSNVATALCVPEKI